MKRMMVRWTIYTLCSTNSLDLKVFYGSMLNTAMDIVKLGVLVN